MKINNNNFFSGKKTKVLLQFNLKSGAAVNSSLISPVLGQYGIKGVELCNKFNLESIKYFKKNILIKVFVLVFKDRSYQFIYKMPPLFFLFSSVASEGSIFLQDIYKICLIKGVDIKNKPFKTIYKNILNSLNNYQYKLYE